MGKGNFQVKLTPSSIRTIYSVLCLCVTLACKVTGKDNEKTHFLVCKPLLIANLQAGNSSVQFMSKYLVMGTTSTLHFGNTIAIYLIFNNRLESNIFQNKPTAKKRVINSVTIVFKMITLIQFSLFVNNVHQLVLKYHHFS